MAYFRPRMLVSKITPHVVAWFMYKAATLTYCNISLPAAGQSGSFDFPQYFVLSGTLTVKEHDFYPRCGAHSWRSSTPNLCSCTSCQTLRDALAPAYASANVSFLGISHLDVSKPLITAYKTLN